LGIGPAVANRRLVRRTIAGVIALILSTLGAAPPAAPPGFPELYKSIKPSVVYILATSAGGAAASGSGFVYDSDATETIVVTAAHVVAGAQHVDVVLDSDKSKRIPAKILQNDAKRDVTFLSIAVGNRRPLKLADRDQITEGTSVAAIGYPRASFAMGDELRPTVHLGIVSAVRLNGEVIQVDAATDHGDSGGPIVDTKTGRVIGIVRGAMADPTYLVKGLERDLPGSTVAAAAPVIYGVRNNLISVAQSPAPGTGAATAGSGAEYRMGYVTPSLSIPAGATNTPVTLAEYSLFQTRVRSHFTSDNSLYAIPANASLLFADPATLRTTCTDLKVNGIIYPTTNWSLINGELKTIAGFYAEDCNGVPFYGRVVRMKREHVDRLTAAVLNDAMNAAIDQNLSMFDTFREEHHDSWLAMIKSGAPADVASNHVLAILTFTDGKYRVVHLNPVGLGAKAGLREGDLISSVDGAPIEAGTLTWELAMALDAAHQIEVKRPDGTITINLH
jgi:S1-C subfamily serine protease